jgi:hypothetical protein
MSLPMAMFAGQTIEQPQVAVSMSERPAVGLPPSPAASSLMVIVQVPFGSSPMKAPSASSVASGLASVEMA